MDTGRNPVVPISGRAYLTLEQVQDDEQPLHTISSASFRIGRLPDNDLVIRDPSVSRHHAEIRRRRNGSFEVFDLDSMNGVFVNGNRIRESALNQGDNLDVGDVRMTFTADEIDQLASEETVMLGTILPERPFPELVPEVDPAPDSTLTPKVADGTR